MQQSATFSSLIKDFRRLADLSQERLAAELKVSFATVNRWENDRTVPDNSTLHGVADFVRKQGAAVAHIADLFGRGGFTVPAKTRRAKRKKDGDDAEVSAVLDVKSMENLLWKAACSIRGEKDAPKFKDYILPLLFIKRLSDVFEDEVKRLVGTYGDEATAREILDADHSLVRFYIPERARWGVIAGRVEYDWPENERPKTTGELLTTATRLIAKENPTLQGVIDLVDFNETRNGEREISDEALGRIIELFSQPRYRLGLDDVKEPDFLGRAYEYLLRKFAEGQGQSAGEFFTPTEVGMLIAKLVDPKPGEEVYDFCCGSGGLLIKCELELMRKDPEGAKKKPLKLYGQELNGSSYAIARMNMVIHDMEGEIVRGNTMTNPKFLTDDGKLRQFDIVVANPMWNQNNVARDVYDNDPYDRFPAGAPPDSSADWGWLQHAWASLKEGGRAAVVLDTGAASRGSGNQGENKEKVIRKWFVEMANALDGVILLPDNLFYNTTAAGIVVVLRKGRDGSKPILLVNAAREFERQRPKNRLGDNTILRIARAYQGQSTVPSFLIGVRPDDLAANDFNLSPSANVAGERLDTDRDIQSIIDEIAQLRIRQSALDDDLAAVFQSLGYEYRALEVL